MSNVSAACTPSHRKRIRGDSRRDRRLRDEEVDVALELFDETFAAGPARAPYDPGDGVADYEFVGAFDATASSSATCATARRRAPIAPTICTGSPSHPDAQGDGRRDRSCSTKSSAGCASAKRATARRRDVVARRLRADAALLREARLSAKPRGSAISTRPGMIGSFTRSACVQQKSLTRMHL